MGPLVGYYSFARNTNQVPETFLAQHTEMDFDRRQKTVRIFAGYEKRKKKAGYLDYDVFDGRRPRIMAQIKGMFDFILVTSFRTRTRCSFGC